jgi:site-specific recombinase XerD
MVGTIASGVDEHFEMFLCSKRVEGVTDSTLSGYERKYRFISKEIDLNTATRQDIERFLLQFNNPGNRHGYFRIMRAYYNWREKNFSVDNPIKTMKAPRLPKLILPSLSMEQVRYLIDYVDSTRDKAIIALFTESGLRLSELCGIKGPDIYWGDSTVRVMGKGQKEALAPFGKQTEQYLKQWLSEYQPDGGTIWGINKWGITAMLRRLENTTGITCNPHTFRRTFACLLRKAGLDTMTIKDLGRWESIEMVQRYTRSITFQDCMRMYREVVSDNTP